MNVRVDLNAEDCSTSQWLPDVHELAKWMTCAWQCDSNTDRPVNVSIRMVDSKQAAKLNRQYRGKNHPTNVLSFPAQLPEAVTQSMEYIHLGDIVICPSVVEQEASEQQKQAQAHWAHLAIHGFLHLQGYDHGTTDDADIMEALEIQALEKLGFSNPYLIG